MRLEGKTAIITGAGSGFGEGMAKRFAEEGANVVVADLNGEQAERVTQEIGAQAVAIKVDVSQAADNHAMADLAISRFGSLDIFVLNAGSPIKTKACWMLMRTPSTGWGTSI